MIEELQLDLDSDKPRIRYGAAKALRQCSTQDPAEVYPHCWIAFWRLSPGMR
jgi:hypothetical protein